MSAFGCGEPSVHQTIPGGSMCRHMAQQEWNMCLEMSDSISAPIFSQNNSTRYPFSLQCASIIINYTCIVTRKRCYLSRLKTIHMSITNVVDANNSVSISEPTHPNSSKVLFWYEIHTSGLIFSVCEDNLLPFLFEISLRALLGSCVQMYGESNPEAVCTILCSKEGGIPRNL